MKRDITGSQLQTGKKAFRQLHHCKFKVHCFLCHQLFWIQEEVQQTVENTDKKLQNLNAKNIELPKFGQNKYFHLWVVRLTKDWSRPD